MTANEVRIGNYYQHHTKVEKVTPNVIEALWEFEDREWIKPIPLTEEWCVKLGLEDTFTKGYFYKMVDEKTYVSQTPNGFFIAIQRCFDDEIDGSEEYTTELNIKYVHQIQNLYFALTGEELKIKE